ncbi:putative repeat protein (TIGR03833 family) [Metabacillus malikii]|uniref:Repeat protein (TIGR03833 family) n=1 Tax=Metabacillus malikii TaxID=1504265 RepID=A0ABT9ZHT5_9BACI|nr:putative repeat protein (TIGR03833 family) [Metabacillus malikii]
MKDVLTKSESHPHGIKVRLTDGQIGRVKEIY